MLVAAEVDWDALAAIAGGLVFLATLVLAVATWRMAKATKEMASAASEQVRESRRQTAALEATVDQGERNLSATTVPVLSVVRAGENVAAVSWAEGEELTVVIENSGPVTATLREGEFRFDNRPPPVGVEMAPSGPLKPGAQANLSGTPSSEIHDRIRGGRVELTIRVGYIGPAGRGQVTFVTLTAKGGGERWLITRAEQHEPAN